MASQSSGVVSQTEPRLVMAAQFTKEWQVPKVASRASVTVWQASLDPMSAATCCTLHPAVPSEAAAASPFSWLRPTSRSPAAPSDTKRSATA